MGTVPLDGSVIVVWRAPPSGSGATVRVQRGRDLPGGGSTRIAATMAAAAVAPKTIKRAGEVSRARGDGLSAKGEKNVEGSWVRIFLIDFNTCLDRIVNVSDHVLVS